MKCATASPNVSCPASDPVSVDIEKIGMQVVESATGATKPKMAVGGIRSPATGVLELDVRATVRYAEAHFDSGPLVRASFTDSDAMYSACRDLTPNATVDMPIDAVCPTVGGVRLPVETAPLSDGERVLTIRVVDWSGKEAVQRETIVIANSTPTPFPYPSRPRPRPRRLLPPRQPPRRGPPTGGRARSRSGLRPRAVSGSGSR